MSLGGKVLARRALSLALAVLLSFAMVPVMLESAEADEAASVATAVAASGYDYTQQTTGAGLGLSVSWNEPTCDEPMAFHLEGRNGSGDYRYYLNGVYVDDPGYMTEDCRVVDPSRTGGFGESKDIPFTFYASGTYDFAFYVMDMGNNATKRLWVRVVVGDPQHPSIGAIADNVAGECLAAGNVTDFEKALWLHDWVIDNCDYDNSLVYCGAEGALARGTGTCESYHRAYVMLLNRVGIATKRIEGNGHVWTGVQMDGKWYQVDATWDDGAQTRGYPDANHLYFGMDDHIAGLVHSDYQKVDPQIGCDSLDLNYFVKTREISSWSESYIAAIAQNLEAGEEFFSIVIEHDYWPEGYLNAFYNVIAYDLSQREWVLGGGTSAATVAVSYADKHFDVALVGKREIDLSASNVPDQSTTPSRPSAPSNSGAPSKPSDTVTSAGSGKPSSGSSGTSGSAAGSSSGASIARSAGVWKKSGGRWWYRHSNGSYTRNGWELIDGKWYHFDCRGWMQTGWLKTGGKWYYLSGSGAMKTGWLKLGSAWYHLKDSGAMATGWYRVGSCWYWSSSSGAMAANRWVGNYYLTGSGAMATNTWIGRYHVSASGLWDATR